MKQIRAFFAPDISEDIRGEFMLASAAELQRHARLLFLALLLTTPTAALAAAPGASTWVRFGAPFAMALFCLFGFINLSRDLRVATSVRRATRFVKEATYGSSAIAVMCSAWCVYSWLGASPGERIYYPVIVALGAFSTAYCLSAARGAAMANLVINLVPMELLLFTSGERMDLAFGVSLAMAAAFHLHMINSHQARVVDLLRLQKDARELALSDPLTGLLNRRALIGNALELGRQAPLRLLVIDIDHFKAINDRHGHDMGDEVLREVAERLAIRAELTGSVARIGGEEFAVLGRADELPEALALGLLHDVRTAIMPHGAAVTVSLGIAEGPVESESDWRQLYQRADAALYKAKSNGRNRIEQAEAVVDGTAVRPENATAAA